MKQFISKFMLLIIFFVASTACNLGVLPTVTPQQMPIVYYYFASMPGNTFPAGSVVIIPNVFVLSPTLSTQGRSNDTANNIQIALQSMINDPRNVWTKNNLTINSVTFNAGEATVILTGQISGVGGAMLSAARMQFLMTVFAEPDVKAVTITLNGDNIGNLGISHSSESKVNNYKYNRAEIETYMSQNALNP
jgi:hypothetical protein